MRSSKVLVAMAALGLVTALSVLPTQVASAQPPSTQVVVPATGATVSDIDGSAVLDATASAGVTRVQFEVTGGTLNDWVIATATPTIYGWIALWNTDNVISGTYTLQSVANADGSSATSPGISITVIDGNPQLSIALPPSGATVSGTQVVLDAFGPAGLTQVFFEIYAPGCPSDGQLPPEDVCTINATPTIYGYVAVWNSTQVPNGSYAFTADCDFDQCPGAGAGATPFNVNNPAPSTTVIIPSTGATLSGTTATLDASASNATSVKFLLFGGSFGYNAPVICTATATIYGWLCAWNTTSVPNSSYTLVSEASGPGGSTYSSGVGFTVKNPTVSFAGSTVFTYPSESVGVTLNQSSTNTVQVDFTSAGGPGAQLFWGAWTGGASSFSPSSGTVTFAPGQTTATIPLTVNPTTVTGCDSTTPCYPSVTITLTDPTNAVLGSTTVTNVFYAPVPGS